MSSKVTRWIRAGIELCAACWRPAAARTLLPRANRRKKRRYWMIGKVLRIGANICRGHGSSLGLDGDKNGKDVTGEEGGQNKKISMEDCTPRTVSDGGHKREWKVRPRKHKHKRRKTHSKRKMRDRLLCNMQARKNAIDLRSRYLDLQTVKNSDELGISELKKGLFSEKFFKAKGQDKRRHSRKVPQIDREVYEKVLKRFGHCKSAWTEFDGCRRDVVSVEEKYNAVRVKGRPGKSHVGEALEGPNRGKNLDDHKQVDDLKHDDDKLDEDGITRSEVGGQNQSKRGRNLVIRGRFDSEKHEEGIIDLFDATEVHDSSSDESVISAEGDSQGVFNYPAYPRIINRLTARCVGLDIYDDNDCVDDYDGDVDDDDDEEEDDEDEITTGSFAASHKMTTHDPIIQSDEFSHNDGQRDRSSIQEPDRAEEDDFTEGSFVISVSIRVDGHKTIDSSRSKDKTQDIKEEGSNGKSPRTNKQEAGDWQDLPGYVHWQSQPQKSPCPEVPDPSVVGEQSVMMLPKASLVSEQAKDFQATMDKPPLHPNRLKKKKIPDEIQGQETTVEDQVNIC